MLIRKLNYLSEFFLWILAFGITLANAPTEVSSYFLIAIFLIKIIISRDTKFLHSLIGILFSLFFIVVLISAICSQYPGESWRGFSRVPKYIFLFFALLSLFSSDKKIMSRFFWVVIAASAITFLNGIFQNIFGFDFFRHNSVNYLDYLHRIQSSFIDANDFGAYIISVLPLTFLFLNRGFSKAKRIMLFVVCLLGFYCLIRTSSRGAWLGFLAGISFYFFVYNKKIAIAIPVLVILLLIITPKGLDRVTGLFKQEKNTVWERTVLWKSAWGMIKERPVLGQGVNTFSEYFPKYKPADYPDLRYAHNSYLQMWSEIGIVGLLLFLSIPLAILIRTLRGIKIKATKGPYGLMLLGLIAGYTGFLVHSIFDNNLFSLMLTTLFWVMSAYIIALNKTFAKELYAEK
ncbi:MAG: O-antigen ligase family protein [Candidatus Omnitrophica bacterium]|jgi:O-antigen ligase|nr:O-antigen ligase family protein [Candidatus Omnitrophota bacterium]